MNETDVETGFQKLEKIDEENFDPERNSQNIVEVHHHDNTANVQTENVVIESESKTEKADLENSEDATKDNSLKEDNNDLGKENNVKANNENVVTEMQPTFSDVVQREEVQDDAASESSLSAASQETAVELPATLEVKAQAEQAILHTDVYIH